MGIDSIAMAACESCGNVVQAHDLMDQLKKSLRAEHVLIHEFIVTFFLSVRLHHDF